MFYNCENLQKLDLSNFNTEIITNMSGTFYGCKNLKQLNLSNFNTKNVLNMSYIFYNCKNLVNLDLSTFNTENVSDMAGMFYGCENTKKLNLTNFNTKNVINMNNLFYNCKNMISLDLSSFNTVKVIDMSNMFYGCKNLEHLDLSNFRTKNVSNMSNMFYGCTNLSDIDLSTFNCNYVKNFDKMFYKCKNFIYSNLSIFYTEDYNNYRKEYYIEFIDKDNYLINKIKEIKLYNENGFIMSRGNKLFIKKKKKANKNISQNLILNLVDANNKIKNKSNNEDCIILAYDVNNIETFKNIEILWNKIKTKKNDNNLIYLIGINFETKDKIILPEPKIFSNLNKINHIIISTKNDNDILTFLNEFINLRKIKYMPKFSYKVLILGHYITGKTALLKRIVDNKFDDFSTGTIGIDFGKKVIKLENGLEISLRIWDTSGTEMSRSFIKNYIKGTDCVILLYDITYRKTFDKDINYWNEVLLNDGQNIKLKYLIGNKLDRQNEREVSNEEAKEFARDNELYFFEISCKNATGIDLFLEHLTNEIIKIIQL